MQLLKPVWVSHDGRPIFSVDIHPDGSRFATGGQGDETGSGKVIIWNMSPVRNEGDEKDETVPKILCQMDNHIACVNCVRWSRNGKYLASCGDDKVGIIWQTSRYQAPSTVFGSNGKVVNVEQWRPVSTLRGHIGDILDLSWSPNDIWLATSSIDNTIIVWNALRFPEQVAVLKGHTGLVKGVTWDPVGKYLASQSDDKSLKIWRTLDWQQEATITEPFKECGGTTHVLRLSWSPDGHYIVSAHAMNNSGPTAQIIEREGWRATLDFVGHRKAVTVVRFNPNILIKKIKKGDEKSKQYCCCAIGSRDHSLSIWLTALKRPLVVTHDLFTNSILDISWSKDGMELLCCSGDGTVAYVCFAREEIGVPLLDTEIQTVLENTYGKNLPLMNQGNQINQVIESTDMLNLQQEKKIESERQKIESPCKYSNSSSMNGELLLKPRDKQIETRTADGRRRITPIFIAPQPDIGDAPLPFDSKRVLSSSTKEPSRIVVEKQDRVTAPGLGSSSSPSSITPNTSPQAAKPSSAESTPKSSTLTPKKLEPTLTGECATFQPMAALEKSQVKKPAQQTPKETSQKETSSGKTSDKEGSKKEDQYKDIRNNLSIKRKLDEKGRVKTVKLKKPKEDTKSIPSVAAPSLTSHTFEREVVTQPVLDVLPDILLPVPHIDKLHSKQIYGKLGTESSLVLEVENSIRVGSNILHKLQCRKGGSLIWDQVLSSRAIAVAGSNHVACVACEDHSLCIYSCSGRKLFPNMVLNSKISTLKCSGFYVMAITQKGHLFVWDMKKHTAVIKNEPLYSIISGSEKIQKTNITSEGVPVITLSTNISYTFSTELGCWVILSNKNDPIQRCSDHNKYTPNDPFLRSQGTLQSLLSSNDQLGITAGKMLHGGVNMQHSSTLVSIENHLASSHSLQSGTDYKFWLHTYVRFLVQEGVEKRLREICDELLGPVYKSKSLSWQQHILGFDKRDLLREVLPLVGQNLRFQRLYTEYQDQLESLSK